MAESSRWRRAARRAIEEALASLPADAPPAAIRKAIRDAYPFGERAHHPYACWLKEQRAALKERGLGKSPATPQPATVRFVVRLGLPGSPWLRVDCGWCQPGREGCLVCGRHRERLREVFGDLSFVSLQKAAATDPVALAALGDFLEESLGDRCGL